MIDIKPAVVKSVNQTINDLGMCCKYNLYPISPKVGDTMPCLIYNEVENKDYKRVLNNEYAIITIQFTNYTMNPRDFVEMANIVDIAMCDELGFKKSYSGQIVKQEDGPYHQIIRFTAIINQDLDVYKN